MPMISTFGSLSSRGFGQFATVRTLPPGGAGLGLFCVANSTSVTNRYTFSDRSMVVSTALNRSMSQGAACANADRMIGSTQISSGTVRYEWATGAVSAGPTFSRQMNGGAATSNPEVGIFNCGNAATRTGVYSYSANTMVDGAPALKASRWLIASGNKDIAIFRYGSSTDTARYNYAAASWTASTALSATSVAGAACGVAEFGIFALGGNTTTTNKYGYATDSVALASDMSTQIGGGTAVGNDSMGVFASGSNTTSGTGQTTTSEYGWSSDLSSSGTSLTQVAVYPAGASSGISGVNV